MTWYCLHFAHGFQKVLGVISSKPSSPVAHLSSFGTYPETAAKNVDIDTREFKRLFPFFWRAWALHSLNAVSSSALHFSLNPCSALIASLFSLAAVKNSCELLPAGHVLPWSQEQFFIWYKNFKAVNCGHNRSSSLNYAIELHQHELQGCVFWA